MQSLTFHLVEVGHCYLLPLENPSLQTPGASRTTLEGELLMARLFHVKGVLKEVF